MLRARPDVERSEWIQRLLARACLGNGCPAQALEWIDKALAKLSIDHYRSEFLELRFEIRSELGDRDAIEDLEAAVHASRREKERVRLTLRLEEAKRPR